MNAAEIKLQLFRKIDKLKDKQLEKVYKQLLSLLSSTENQTLSQAEMDAMLEESEKDIKQGDVISHDLVKQEVLNWRDSQSK